MRISDWSSDVCSSDLLDNGLVDVGQDFLHGFKIHAFPCHLGRQPVFGIDAVEGRRLPLRLRGELPPIGVDRKSVLWGWSVYVGVALGGRRNIQYQKLLTEYVVQAAPNIH